MTRFCLWRCPNSYGSMIRNWSHIIELVYLEQDQCTWYFKLRRACCRVLYLDLHQEFECILIISWSTVYVFCFDTQRLIIHIDKNPLATPQPTRKHRKKTDHSFNVYVTSSISMTWWLWYSHFYFWLLFPVLLYCRSPYIRIHNRCCPHYIPFYRWLGRISHLFTHINTAFLCSKGC